MELMMMAAGNQIKVHGHGAGNLHNFQAEASAAAADAAATALEVGDGASARWPRQETLTLLEIRSRLDSRFREANQKGPLWDEVSRYPAHSINPLPLIPFPTISPSICFLVFTAVFPYFSN